MKTQIKFKSYLTRLRGLMLTLITLLMLGVVQVHADSWTKVTSAPASWAGEYLLVYENESSPTAGKAWTGVDEASCGADVTISSNTISTKPDAAVSITVAAVTGGYSIKINGGTNNGKYLGRSANSNGMDFSTTAVVNTFSFESNSVKIVGAGNAVLRYNSSSGQYRFRYFKSSSYSSQKTIQLYKKSASSCTSITPSLSYTSTSLVVGGTSSSPTVSGNSGSGAVTYSSSDTDVATVNSSTGVVTAVGAGSATITASIASATSGGTTYCSGSATASFTISLPRYTVSFSTGTGNPTQANIQEANAGDGIELPDGPTPACSSNGWEFAGWATSSCSESAIAPILYLPGDTYYPESDETLYAVYRKLSSGTSTASFAASNISNLTEHPVYNLDWLHTASGAELYIEAGQRYTGNPAAWNVTSGTSHYAILDAHRKISGISITVTDGSKYKFGSVESDAGTATLTTSSNTQTVSCSGNVTRVVLYAGSSYQVRATNITITYYNSNFNSNPTCCTQLGTINGSVNCASSEDGIVTVSGWTYAAGSTGTTESNVTSYTVKLYKWNSGTSTWALANNNSTTGGASGTQATRTGIAANNKSVTFSGLEYGETYKFTVQAIGTGDYYTGEETAVTTINSNALTDNKFLNKYSIYIDDGNNDNYAHNWINSLTSHNGSVDITLSLAEHDYYQYKLSLGGVIWWGNTGKMTTDSKWTFTDGVQNCKLTSGLAGTYTFTFYGATTEVGVEYPKANQPNNRSIWFDKSVITGWTSESASDIFYRIGKTSHNTNNTETGGTAWTLVPGTDRFYTTKTMEYTGFVAWQIANNKSWSGDNNSIYLVNGSGYAITKAINFQKSVVGASGVTVVPTTSNNTENGCNYWNVDVTDGMLKHTATISSYSNGTVTVAYTKYDGTGQTSFTSGSNSDLAHRTILTITATPNTGFTLTSLTVNGSAFTSGDTHILAADATIAATFTAKTTTVTLDRQGGTTGSTSVTATYGSAMPSATMPTKTGYAFAGYFTETNGGGTKYYNADGSIAANWNFEDATKTLYAHWVADQFVDLVHSNVVTNKTASYNFSDASLQLTDETPATTGTCNQLHYHFVGWITKAKHDAGTAIADGDIQTGNKTPDNSTYYAVWAKEVAGGGAATYNRITSTGDLSDGDYLIVCEDEDLIFDGSLETLDATSNYEDVTISSNSIASTTDIDAKAFTITTSAGSSTIKSKSGYYIGQTSDANGLSSNTSTEYTNTISFSSNDVNIVSSGGAYLRYNSASNQTRFRYFKSSTYTGQQAIQLYKYTPNVSWGDYVASCGATYDITLNKNNSDAGSANGAATITANAAQLNSGFTAPTRAGYQVEAYYTNAACTTKVATAEGVLQKNITVSSTLWTDANGKWVKGGDATFYANWEAKQCVITLNNVGADIEAGTPSVTATYGASTNLTKSITVPEKTGYVFGGYYTEANGEGTQLIDATGAWLANKTGYTNASKQWQLDQAALTLYAKWTLETYTVNWYVNGVSVAHEDNVPYNRPYSYLNNEPAVANNALASCNSNKFIGWVTAAGQYTADGGTKASQFDPYAVTSSTKITSTNKDFYAMFAEETGSAFTLDGENGSTQSVKIYATISGTNYYATGTASNSTYTSTTDVGEANTYTFTKISDGIYTIKHGTKYVNQKKSGDTKFDEIATAYNWEITSVGSGLWKVKCKTNDENRAIIIQNSGTPSFGTYATSNIPSNPLYLYVKLGSNSLSNYRTGCCDEKITLSVTGADNGSYTLKFNNVDQTSGAEVSTCAASTVEFKVTANAGYTLTGMSISGTDKTLTITPSPITTGLPSTAEMTYTVSVPALATGTLTITPTFTQTYSATYDLDGGETTGSTATTRYQSGESVTLITPDPTKTGYDFTGWTVTKAGGGTVAVSAGAFTMPSDNVTITAGWSAKALTSISVTPTTAEVYVGQYVELPVTYDPADILTKGYTLVATPAYCVTTGSTNNTLKLTGGRSGVTITEDKVETVSIKANADNTKTASVTITVKPLPVDHYLDLVHGETFADQSASIVDNALSAAYTAPGHADVPVPGEGNACEKGHLHLVGWIESEWADAHLTATMTEMMAAEDGSGNALFHAAYDPMTASGKTYYAVWGHEVE